MCSTAASAWKASIFPIPRTNRTSRRLFCGPGRLLRAPRPTHFLPNSMRIVVFAIVVALCGCASQSPPTDADEAFARLSDEFIKGHIKWRPAMGTSLGLHEYDGRVTDLSRGSIDAEVTRLKDFETALVELKGR